MYCCNRQHAANKSKSWANSTIGVAESWWHDCLSAIGHRIVEGTAVPFPSNCTWNIQKSIVWACVDDAPGLAIRTIYQPGPPWLYLWSPVDLCWVIQYVPEQTFHWMPRTTTEPNRSAVVVNVYSRLTLAVARVTIDFASEVVMLRLEPRYPYVR